MTAMYYRPYDNALGRFHSIDALAELAPGITPYRFGFNNWSDPTGLFESEALALSYMNQNNLSGVISLAADGLYHLTTSVFDYVMSGDELIISAIGYEVTVGGSSGGGSSGSSSSGPGGPGGPGGPSRPGNGIDWKAVNTGISALGVGNGIKTEIT